MARQSAQDQGGQGWRPAGRLPTTPSLLTAALACLVAATTYTVGLLRLGRGRDPQPS